MTLVGSPGLWLSVRPAGMAHAPGLEEFLVQEAQAALIPSLRTAHTEWTTDVPPVP